MNSRFESLKFERPSNDGFVQYKSKREKKEKRFDEPKPKPIQKPKLNIHDENQFPDLNISNAPVASKLNFGKLFDNVKTKTKKQKKIDPNCVRWYKVNGQYRTQLGDMTEFNQMVKQRENDKINNSLQHVYDVVELTTQNLMDYLGEEEYSHMYEDYEMCESIKSLSEYSDSESDVEEIDEGDESNRGLE